MGAVQEAAAGPVTAGGRIAYAGFLTVELAGSWRAGDQGPQASSLFPDRLSLVMFANTVLVQATALIFIALFTTMLLLLSV